MENNLTHTWPRKTLINTNYHNGKFSWAKLSCPCALMSFKDLTYPTIPNHKKIDKRIFEGGFYLSHNKKLGHWSLTIYLFFFHSTWYNILNLLVQIYNTPEGKEIQ